MSSPRDEENNYQKDNDNILAMKRCIKDWLSEDNLAKARGKDYEEIKKLFSNNYEPIAKISSKYLRFLDDKIIDNKVYSGRAYFINHVLNSHSNIAISKYYSKLVAHKSFFEQAKEPYKSLRDIKDIDIGGVSLAGALSAISPDEKTSAAGKQLSGRNDTHSK
jgi:transcriptional regulator of heat shock response